MSFQRQPQPLAEMHTHLLTSSCPRDHLPNGNYDLCRFRAAARRIAAALAAPPPPLVVLLPLRRRCCYYALINNDMIPAGSSCFSHCRCSRSNLSDHSSRRDHDGNRTPTSRARKANSRRYCSLCQSFDKYRDIYYAAACLLRRRHCHLFFGSFLPS